MNIKITFRIFVISYILAVFAGTGVIGLIGGFPISTNLNKNQLNVIIPNAKVSANTAPDIKNGYTEKMGMRETLATFEYGLDAPYDRIYSSAPHFWEKLQPVYSYTPVDSEGDKYKTINFTSDENTDNSNYWYVLPDSGGAKDGSCAVVYKLNAPRQLNYENFSPYNQLRLIWRGTNPESKDVNIAVSVYNPENKKWYELGKYNGQSGKKYEVTFDLRCIKQEERGSISKIKFTTNNADIGTKANGDSHQKNEIFYIDVYSENTVKKDIKIDDLNFSTEYLGNVQQSQWGPYSASGFYDKEDKKWKLWYGCGFKEAGAADNIFYIETTDPQKGWSLPYRIFPYDPNGVLVPATQPPGYGGDPAVIKLKGVYYMYITGITRGLRAGVGSSIYLLTSTDGKSFNMVDKPAVPLDLKKHTGAYGQGAPSVIYKEGTFYMYYYSTYDLQGGCMRRTSKDGYNWSEPVYVFPTAIDVKYVDEIGKWIGCYYSEQNQFTKPQASATRIVISDDGVNWIAGNADEQLPAQDFSAVTNHNPGFIGDEFGHGWTTMFLTYGDNDLRLNQNTSELAIMQMDTRQLEWSRITIK
jgi:hypothetical protein